MSNATINNEIAFCQKLETYELVESYEKGQLKGKLKEIAAEIEEESNPVIMIVKYKN
jgi:argininosuccinate lyase